MKIETKRKIIHWVKGFLNYNECSDPMRNYVITDKGKIQIVRSSHRYPNYELKMISNEQIHFASGMAMLTEMEKNKIIKYEFVPDVNPDNTQVIATIKVITQ